MQKCTEAQTRAVLKQFDFVIELTEFEIKSARVERIDEKLLFEHAEHGQHAEEIKPEATGIIGLSGCLKRNVHYYLFDSNRTLIKDVGACGERIVEQTWWERLLWKPIQTKPVWNDTTVGDALFSCIKNPVCVVKVEEYGFHNSLPSWYAQVTIYKPPQSFTLIEWVKKQQLLAEQELQKKLAEIDAAAEK